MGPTEIDDLVLNVKRPLDCTSLSLDSFCVTGWAGKSLYPDSLDWLSRDLSGKVKTSSGPGEGKLGPGPGGGAPFLLFSVLTVSQETALISGGKAPMVLISAVHGACCVGSRGTGLATPVAGA